jgi:hypothetical protein
LHPTTATGLINRAVGTAHLGRAKYEKVGKEETGTHHNTKWSGNEGRVLSLCAVKVLARCKRAKNRGLMTHAIRFPLHGETALV